MPTIARDPVAPTTRAMLHSAARANAVGIGKPFRGRVRAGRIYYDCRYAILLGELGNERGFRSSYILEMSEVGVDINTAGEILLLVETRNSTYLAWIKERDYLDYLDKRAQGNVRMTDN